MLLGGEIMEEHKKAIIKKGTDFSKYPAMRVAKIYEPNPNQVDATSSDHLYNGKREIAKPILNFTADKTVWIKEPIEELFDIDWMIVIKHSHLDVKSSMLMLSGNLMAELYYSAAAGEEMFILKTYIPWKLNQTITCQIPPIESPKNIKEEQLFTSPDGSVMKQRVHKIYRERSIDCELVEVTITSAEDIEKIESGTNVHLFVDVILEVKLLQNQ